MREALAVLIIVPTGCASGRSLPTPVLPRSASEISVASPDSSETEAFSALIPMRYHQIGRRTTEEGKSVIMPFFKSSAGEELAISVRASADAELIDTFTDVRSRGVAAGETVVKNGSMWGTVQISLFGKGYNRKIVKPVEISAILTDGKGVLVVQYTGNGQPAKISKEIQRTVQSLRH
jgi:hypothetical protein